MSKSAIHRTLAALVVPVTLAGCGDAGDGPEPELQTSERIAMVELELSSSDDLYLLHPLRVAVEAELEGQAFATDLLIGMRSSDGASGCVLGAMPVEHEGGAAVYAHEAEFVVERSCHELVGRDDVELFASFDPWNRLGDRPPATASAGVDVYSIVAAAALSVEGCESCETLHTVHPSPGLDAQLRELNLSSVVAVLPSAERRDGGPAAERPEFSVTTGSRVVGLGRGEGLETGRVQLRHSLRPTGSNEVGLPLVEREAAGLVEASDVLVPSSGVVTTISLLEIEGPTRAALIDGAWAELDDFELVTCLETDFDQAIYNGEDQPRANDCAAVPVVIVRAELDESPGSAPAALELDGPEPEKPLAMSQGTKLRGAEVWGNSWGADAGYGFGWSGLSFQAWLEANAADGHTSTHKGISVHSAGSWFEAGIDAHATVFGTDVNIVDIYATLIAYEQGGGGAAMGASLFYTDFVPPFEIQLADNVPVTLQDMFDAAGLGINPWLTISHGLAGVNFNDGCGSVSAGLWLDATIGISTDETWIKPRRTGSGAEVEGTITPFFNVAAKAGTEVHYDEYVSGGIVATLNLVTLNLPFTVTAEYIDYDPLDAVRLAFTEEAKAVLTALSGNIAFYINYEIPWPICWFDCKGSHNHVIATWDGISQEMTFFEASQQLDFGSDASGFAYCQEPTDQLLVGDFDGDQSFEHLCHRADGLLDPDNGDDWELFSGTPWCLGQQQIYVGDFDGDGRDDLLCANDWNDGLAVDYAAEQGQFLGSDWARGEGWCVADHQTLEIGDYNDDGRDDLLCRENDGDNWIDYADQNGQFHGADWGGEVLPNSFCGRYDGALIGLRTAHDRYVRALDAGSNWGLDQPPWLGEWEQFVVECHGDDVALETAHGRYLRAVPGDMGWLIDQQVAVGEWERLAAIPNDDGTWSFRTHHNRFIRAGGQDEGYIINQADVLGAWEKFEVIEL